MGNIQRLKERELGLMYLSLSFSFSLFFFCNFFYFIEIQLLHSAILVSGIQHSGSIVCVCMKTYIYM